MDGRLALAPDGRDGCLLLQQEGMDIGLGLAESDVAKDHGDGDGKEDGEGVDFHGAQTVQIKMQTGAWKGGREHTTGG